MSRYSEGSHPLCGRYLMIIDFVGGKNMANLMSIKRQRQFPIDVNGLSHALGEHACHACSLTVPGWTPV